jgi:hypothetical protein
MIAMSRRIVDPGEGRKTACAGGRWHVTIHRPAMDRDVVICARWWIQLAGAEPLAMCRHRAICHDVAFIGYRTNAHSTTSSPPSRSVTGSGA